MKILASILLGFLFTSAPGQNNIWKVYNSASTNLPENKITSLIIDKNNNKWIGSQEGLILFDGDNGKTLTTKNSKLPSDKILSILELENTIWIGTALGLLQIDEKKWKVSNTENSNSPSDKIRKIVKDYNGNIWLATEKGLAKYNGKNWTVFSKKTKKIKNDDFISLDIDKENNIWAGTKKGLLRLSDESWKVYTQDNSGLPHNIINSLATDDYDRIWIGAQEGISSFDGAEWVTYKALKRKMKHYSIYIDENDNKWIGTEKALLVLNQDGVNEKTLTNKSNLVFKVINNISKNNTKFSYYLPIASKVSIKLYTFQGKEITTIFEEKNLKGQHYFYYNTRHLSSGTYFCQFRTNESKQTQKIVVMK
jgi:ligand-binding sensor domain-containing protein